MENFINMCRFCLCSKGSENISITDLPIVFLFSLDYDSSLPMTVCTKCSVMVNNFNEFSEEVRNNQEYLQSILVFSTEDNHSEPSVHNEETTEVVELEMLLNADGSETYYPDLDDADIIYESEIDEPITEEASPTDTYQQKLKPSKAEIEEEDRLIAEYFKFSCDLCQEPTKDFIELKRHFRAKHKITGYHRCCDRKLYKRCKLLEHIRVHLDPMHFTCKLCGKRYRSKDYLQKHHRLAHERTEKKYECNQCSRTFMLKGQLSNHMNCHVQAQCPKCDKVLAGKASLAIHMVSMHSDLSRLICDTCGREFKTKISFERHIQEHQGVYVAKRYTCDLCPAVVTTRATLRKHMIVRHATTNEQFTCDECNTGKLYPNKFALQSHKRKVHVEEKYGCEFCDRRFKSSNNLREHRAIHTKEKLYQCEFCPASFNSKANMYMHKKRNHPKEWAAGKAKQSAERTELD